MGFANLKVALVRFAVFYGVLCCFFLNNPSYHTSLSRLSELNSKQVVSVLESSASTQRRLFVEEEFASESNPTIENEETASETRMSLEDESTTDHSVEDESSHPIEHEETTDGHTQSNEPHSIFGSLVMIDTKLYTVMILIIVGMVLFVEHLFISFHEMSMDTPFHKMINAIEQELMNVGCTAFIFKVFLNTNSLVDHDTFFALEFADILVPLFTFCNCMLGVVLIYMSIKQCDVWSKAFHLKLDELLDGYLDELATLNSVNAYWRWFFPSELESEIEFRIKHGIFCDMFKLQRNAFAFDEYVNCVFEKFVLLVIKISPMNWLGLCVCILLNYARTALHIEFIHCDGEHVHEEAYLNCVQNSYIYAFIAGGVLLFFTTVILWLISRYYEAMIISNIGIRNKEHYIPFLKHMEQTEQKAKKARRYNEAQIREAVNKAKVDKDKRRMKGVSGKTQVDSFKKWVEDFHRANSQRLQALSRFLQGMDTEEETSYRKGTFREFRISSRTSPKGGEAPGDDDSSSSDDGESCITKYSSSSMKRKSKARIHVAMKPQHASIKEEEDHEEHDDGKQNDEESARDFGVENQVMPMDYSFKPQNTGISGMTGDDGSSAQYYAKIQNDVATNNTSPTSDKTSFVANDKRTTAATRGSMSQTARSILVTGQWVLQKFETSPQKSPQKEHKEVDWKTLLQKKGKHVQSVFLFGRPGWYFAIVRFIILFISFYNALWLVNFCAIGSIEWRVFTLLPGLLSAIVYIFIVKKAALLRALFQLDHDALLEVIEKNEDRQLMLSTTRTKLLERLVDVKGDACSTIYSLFSQLDEDDSNRLSRKEFETFMGSLDLTFSRRKWKQIFAEIDCNYDDNISFEEFFLFLFPNHDVAKAMEIRRLKIIKNNVDKKAILLAQKRNQGSNGRNLNKFNYKSFHGDFESSRSGRTMTQVDMINSMKKSGVVGNRLLQIARSIKNRRVHSSSGDADELSSRSMSYKDGNEGSSNNNTVEYGAFAPAERGTAGAGGGGGIDSEKSLGMMMEDV